MVNKIVVPVEVTSNGTTDKETKKAKELGAAYKLAGAAAASVRVPSATAAARQGVANKGASQAGIRDAQDSNTARGLGGLTGAAGRDFAAQAQGLGGLVHVYATFAANLFAVSAAFSALSKAADTTNMVKGLDQLGAASGRALGSTAKQLALVTDGALSLRDAMTATAQASAGGMSGENIFRLGKVAKQASQALGVDMPNAVSRLSRGITKLEPELLDEIGIMVRVDRASENYARTLGKTASALTDFEKRQGFANEVLAQGEQKFGAIELEANAYSKVLASTQNLLQSGLELVNKVLGPLVSLLASSPTALAAALAGVATILLKQAIPAIGMYRERLEASATSARKAAIAANELRKDKMGDLDQKLIQREIAGIKATTAAMAELNAMKTTAKTKSLLLGIDPNAPTKEQISALEKQAAARGKLKLLEDGASNRSVSAAKNAQLEAAQIKVLVNTLKEQYLVQAQLDKLDKTQTRGDKLASYFSQDAARNRIADRLQAKSRQADILGMVGQDLPVKGTIESFRSLGEQISNARKGIYTLADGTQEAGKRMTYLSVASTALKGSLAIVTSTVTTLVSSLFNWFALIGLLVGAFQLLDSWLSKSAKEANKFTESVDLMDASLDNVKNTLDVIAKKKPDDILSVESTRAKAAAFTELSNAFNTLSLGFNKLKNAQGDWDRFWDETIKGIFNSSTNNKLADNLSKGIVSAITLVENGPIKEKAEELFRNLLPSGVDIASESSIYKALNSLTSREFIIRSTELSKAIEKINREVNNAAEPLIRFGAGLSSIDKTMADIGVSLKATDNITKLGSQLTSMGFDIETAMKDPIDSIKVLRDLVNNTNSLSLLPETFQTNLIADKKEINSTAAAIGEYSEALKKAQIERNKLNELQKTQGGNQKVNTILKIRDADIQISSLKNLLDNAKANASSIVSLYSDLSKSVFQKGAEVLVQSMKGAWEQAGIAVAKSYLSVLQAAGGVTADFDADLQKQEIDIQIKLIESQFNLVKASQLLALKIERNTISQDINSATISANSGSDIQRDKALESLRKLNVAKISVEDKISLFDLSDKAAISKFIEVTEKGSEEQKSAFSKLGVYFESLFGKQSQIAKLLGQKTAIDVGAQVSKIQQTAAQRKGMNSTEISNVSTDIEEVQLAQKLSVYYDKALDSRIKDLEIRKFNLNLLNEEIDAKAKIAIAELAISKFTAGSAKAAEATTALTAAQEALAAIRKKGAEGLIALESSQLSKTLKGINELRIRSDEFENQRIKDINEYKEANLNLQEVILENYTKLGIISDDKNIRERSSIELARLELNYVKERSSFELKAANELAAINIKISEAGAGADTSKLEEDKSRLINSLNIQRSTSEALNRAKKEGIILDAEVSARLAEQATQMEKMVSLTEALSGAFEEFGSNLGIIFQQIQKIADLDTNYLVAKSKLQDDLWEKQNAGEDSAATTSKLIALDKKYIDNKLDAYAAEAKAAKSMFKEKTAAHKLFAGIEKVFHIARIAAMIQEAFVAVTTTATVVATDAAKSASGGITAIINTLKGLPPPANFVAGAAMAAVVASLIGGSKGVSVPTAGFTAEDRQETQGTALSWIDGKKVETRRGVFGDSEAKSESIANSLEKIKDNTIDGLGYDARMLRALESIDRAIGSAARSLYGIKELRTGNLGGIIEGTQKSGFFGKKTTTTVTDAGIIISGTIGDLVDGISKTAVQFYEDVQTTTKKWYGGTKTAINRTNFSATTTPEGSAFVKELSNIFSKATDLFVTIGDKAGITADKVKESFRSIDLTGFSLSIKDLKGDDLLKELNAFIGSTLDMAAEELFSTFEKYSKFGEGLLETVIRVIDSSDKLKVALESISVSIVGFTYDTTEALIEAAGGLEEFTSQLRFFSDEFLTEAERLAPITANVKNVLAGLGYSMIDTREEFKTLVQMLDLTNAGHRAIYQTLMDLAPAFAEVYAAAEDTTQSLDRLADQIKRYDSLQVDVLKAQGRDIEALALSRRLETAGMSAQELAMQNLIYARQDEISAINRMASATATIRSTLISFRNAADSTQKAADDAASAVESARNSIANGLYNAQNGVESAKKALADVMRQASDELRGFAKDIRDFLLELTTTDLGGATQKQQLNSLKALFQSQAEAARAGDTKALSEITGTASRLLELAKTQSSTRLDMVRTTAAVSQTLRDVATAAELRAGPAAEAVDPAQQAIESLNAALSELGSWQQAAAEAGVSAAAEAKDYGLQFRQAKEAQDRANEAAATARANLQVAMNAAAAAGLDSAAILAEVDDPLFAINKASSEYYEASIALANAQAIQSSDANLAMLASFRTLTETVASVGQGIIDAILAPPRSAEPPPETAANPPPPPPAANEPSFTPTPTYEIGSREDPAWADWWANETGAGNRFAAGGTHTGGMRLVGEKGPELELTGPSRIFSAAQTTKIMNQDLINEMKALRQEVATLKYTSQQTEFNTRKTKDTLLRVSRDGESLLVTAA